MLWSPLIVTLVFLQNMSQDWDVADMGFTFNWWDRQNCQFAGSCLMLMSGIRVYVMSVKIWEGLWAPLSTVNWEHKSSVCLKELRDTKQHESAVNYVPLAGSECIYNSAPSQVSPPTLPEVCLSFHLGRWLVSAQTLKQNTHWCLQSRVQQTDRLHCVENPSNCPN